MFTRLDRQALALSSAASSGRNPGRFAARISAAFYPRRLDNRHPNMLSYTSNSSRLDKGRHVGKACRPTACAYSAQKSGLFPLDTVPLTLYT